MGKDRKRDKKSKKHKHKHKKSKKHKKTEKSPKNAETNNLEENDESGFEIPLELMNTQSHTPLTPEEYQKRQSQMRRVVDPSTGRVRLIRGEGEVMEEIVTKERHAKINSLATQTDGLLFQKNTVGTLKRDT